MYSDLPFWARMALRVIAPMINPIPTGFVWAISFAAILSAAVGAWQYAIPTAVVAAIGWGWVAQLVREEMEDEVVERALERRAKRMNSSDEPGR